MPIVSVILTSFNHEKYIREAIDSALVQTFTDFELIIWDDASSDDSWAVINSYSDPRIKAFRNDETRRGIYGINKAITEVASGEYIAIHHSDDIWEATKLEKQVEFLDSHPEFGAVFTNALAIGEDSEPLNDPGHFYSDIFDQPNRTRQQWLNHFFYRGNALCHPSILIRTQCYEDCGLYRCGLAQVGDFEMWMRLCLKYEIYVLPEKLVQFRVHANEANTSGNRPETRIRGVMEFHNILKNFLRIQSFEEMVAIFPEAESYYRLDGFEPEFVLAMVALGDNSPHWTKLFGMEVLFDLLGDTTKAQAIKSLYGFDYRNFIALTAKYDVFSLEAMASFNQAVTGFNQAVASLNQAVVERDEHIVNFKHAVAEYNNKIAILDSELYETQNNLAAIFASSSWRVTRPLRAMGSLLLSIRLLKNKVRFYMRIAAISVKQAGIIATAHKIIRRLVRRRVASRPLLHSGPSFYVDNSSDYQEALKETCSKKLTLISMVKNERSIIETFCGHALSIFDRIILIDHGSTDGTKEYIEALARQFSAVECFSFDEPGYYQSQLMTWIVRNIVDHEAPGWVFFLDADEFLPFESRDECNRALAKYNLSPAILMPWLNLVPLNMQSGQIIGEQFLKPDRCAAHCKIAFQPNLIPLDDYVVAQGNHALLVGADCAQTFPAEQSFPIYHLPIRTKLQLRNKILHGIESYRSMGKNRVEGVGVHWDEINQIMEMYGLTDELMAGMIIRYGEPMKPPYVKTLKEMMEEGYTVMCMNVSYSRLPIVFDDICLQEGRADAVNSRAENVQIVFKEWDRIVLNPETRILRFQ